MGFATTSQSEIENSNKCLTYTDDLSLDLNYCADLLLYTIQTSVDASCAKGVSSCSPTISTSIISSACVKSTIASNMYFTYSCYGKF